ncbi:hypothetical protein JMJ77_0001820, partial [Colletotrichum scovillei]
MLLFHSIYALISRFAREHSITMIDAPMPVALGCSAGLLQNSNKPVHRRCIQAPHQAIAQFLDAEVSTLGQGWSEDQIMSDWILSGIEQDCRTTAKVECGR